MSAPQRPSGAGAASVADDDAHKQSLEIARGAHLSPLEKAGKKKRFVVAVDGSTSSLMALQHAAELAHENDELLILTVSSKPASDIKSVYQNAESVLAQAERVLKENYPRPPRFRSYSRVASDPKGEIVDFARKEQADYLVMGTRGLSGLRRFALGSVSDYMTRNAPCPVLVVRTDVDVKENK